MNKIFSAIAGACLLAASASAQLFNFTTIAGSAGQGSVNGVSTNAQFYIPGGAAMDLSGNIFVADTGNHVIRKIAPDGTVSTFAGSPGVSGSTDGANALFNSPQAVAVDGAGNIFVADTGNFTIREITPGGVVSTLAGSTGVPGAADGLGTNALFYEPEGIAVDSSNNVFVADTWNHTIRKITAAGSVSTFAGSPGNFGSTDGIGTNGLFYEPQGITVDPAGNVYVADTGNNTIRRASTAGGVAGSPPQVITLAGSAGNFGSTDANGTNALFNSPQGISIDASGNLYVVDSLNNTIRKVTSGGVVTTIAGTAGSFGSTDATNGAMRFWGAQGVTVNPTNSSILYVVDTGNSTVRQLALSGPNWVSSTLAGSASIGSKDLTGGAARFFWPMNVAADSAGNFYVADAANNTIRKITVAGVVSTMAGVPGVSGSADGPGATARFNSPQGIAVDAAGDIFVSDTGNGTIREIISGNVSTIAGTAGNFGSFDGTNSTAQFFGPQGITVDSSGNVFVADTFNHTIRKITADGVVATFAGMSGIFGGADGTNGVARFNRPTGLAIDSARNLFVTDLFNHTIRKVTPVGAVSTLAGLAGIFGSSDGAGGAAGFFEPEGIAIAGTNVYVADSGNSSIRQLTPSAGSWVASTVAGWPGISGSADGSGIAARFSYPAGLAGAGGNLIVADSANNTIRTGSTITDNPPLITSQPQSQAVNVGTPVTFTVSASGSATLYYQWQFNGVNIPGATASNLSFASAQPGNAGSYSVIVSSPTGSLVSSNATLAVYAPPTITNQPAGQTCLQGVTVTFSVLAGPPPLTYQWQKNGVPLANSANVSGVTTATLTISNVTTADTASYSVLVNNGYGNVSSSPAALTVFYVPPPDSVRPYAWWLLNEGTGSTAFDYSGNNHNGTLNAGTSWTNSGYGGNGVYFNATPLSIVTINNAFLWSGTWTATMWVNRWESKDSSVLISGTHDALKLEQHAAADQVGYTIYGVSDYTLLYVTPLNTWTHLAFVKTATGMSLYVNGVYTSTNNRVASLDATTLGCDRYTVYTDYLDATLNDVRIYTNILTAQQIGNIYNYGRVTPIPAVTLTSPTNGAIFTVSTNITLAANVVSNGQSIFFVEFYAGGTLLGQVAKPPYVWIWTNALAGNYLLTARASYGGATATSPQIGISVVPSTAAASIAYSATNGTLQLSWPADHTGWSLQSQTNSIDAGLGMNWVNIPGANATNRVSIPIVSTNGSVFYRLSYP